MSFYKFGPKDILRNRIKTYPDSSFFVHQGNIYYNNRNLMPGAFAANVGNIPTGTISLYEMNVDRDFSKHTYDPDSDSGVKAKIFPFITKDSSLNSFGTISATSFNQFQYGDIITGSYPMSSSIARSGSEADAPRKEINALQNALDYYKPLSPAYAYSSSLGDKSTQALTLISIPSIFYASSVKKNSVKLNFYMSGTLVAACEDLNRNGELIQTSGSTYAQSNGQGDVVGIVLYNEGFIILTGSWDLTEANHDWGPGSARKGTWLDFAIGANDGEDVADQTLSASFSLNFKGTNYINTVTMFADAPLGDLNYSPNPTFVKYSDNEEGAGWAASGSSGYFQDNKKDLKNTISSSFYDYDAKFKRQTFISKIGIYDENKNLIAVANLAKPIKKLEDRDYTFKLKLDI